MSNHRSSPPASGFSPVSDDDEPMLQESAPTASMPLRNADIAYSTSARPSAAAHSFPSSYAKPLMPFPKTPMYTGPMRIQQTAKLMNTFPKPTEPIASLVQSPPHSYPIGKSPAKEALNTPSVGELPQGEGKWDPPKEGVGPKAFPMHVQIPFEHTNFPFSHEPTQLPLRNTNATTATRATAPPLPKAHPYRPMGSHWRPPPSNGSDGLVHPDIPPHLQTFAASSSGSPIPSHGWREETPSVYSGTTSTTEGPFHEGEGAPQTLQPSRAPLLDPGVTQKNDRSLPIDAEVRNFLRSVSRESLQSHNFRFAINIADADVLFQIILEEFVSCPLDSPRKLTIFLFFFLLIKPLHPQQSLIHGDQEKIYELGYNLFLSKLADELGKITHEKEEYVKCVQIWRENSIYSNEICDFLMMALMRQHLTAVNTEFCHSPFSSEIVKLDALMDAIKMNSRHYYDEALKGESCKILTGSEDYPDLSSVSTDGLIQDYNNLAKVLRISRLEIVALNRSLIDTAALIEDNYDEMEKLKAKLDFF